MKMFPRRCGNSFPVLAWAFIRILKGPGFLLLPLFFFPGFLLIFFFVRVFPPPTIPASLLQQPMGMEQCLETASSAHGSRPGPLPSGCCATLGRSPSKVWRFALESLMMLGTSCGRIAKRVRR